MCYFVEIKNTRIEKVGVFMIQQNNPWDDEKDKDSFFAMIDDALDDIEREKILLEEEGTVSVDEFEKGFGL